MTKHLSFGAASVAALGLAGMIIAQAADKPKHSIQEVMKAVNKGDDAPIRRITKGEGSPEDLKKLVEYYASLPMNEPPKGDAKEWKDKSTRLLDAAKALQAGKEGALDKFKAAVNCKACHTAHRPD